LLSQTWRDAELGGCLALAALAAAPNAFG